MDEINLDFPAPNQRHAVDYPEIARDGNNRNGEIDFRKHSDWDCPSLDRNGHLWDCQSVSEADDLHLEGEIDDG